MKKILLSICMLTIATIAIGQITSEVQDCPVSFKRSNGAGGGCPIAKITLTYATCPTIALPIDSIYQSGAKIDATFEPGIIDCSGSQFQITYCITSSNIAPTAFLTIYFQQSGSFNGRMCDVPSNAGPLPVKLTDFFAKRTSSTVSLSWKTASEINASIFILERKTSLGEFTEAGTVKATNNANGSSYSYTDLSAPNAVIQYRLKMVDADGSFAYSEIRTVKGTWGVSDFTVYPNPSTGSARVTVADITEPTDIQLIDNSGRVLKTIPMNNTNSINIQNLRNGVYLIRIINKNSGETLTKKLKVLN